MKTIRKIFFFGLALLLVQSSIVYGGERRLPSGITVSDLGDTVDSFVEEHADTTAGMAVAVFDEGEELFKNYYGYVDVERRIAVDETSVFEWGSATKLIVWVSVMQLYEQGRIDLTEDVCAYLPDGFFTNLNYETPVTMINLMNHNAGFQESYVDLFVKDADYFTCLEDALRAHEPEQIYEPGTVTAYSNWGVALAAFVVEQISGMNFCDYVHEYIFAPLGMEQTAILPDLSDNLFVQEQRKQLKWYTTEGELMSESFYVITLYPAGMCTSTLNDFKKFAQALLDDNTVLFQKAETREELFSPTSYFGSSEIPLNCHGFWMVPFGGQTIGHGGNTAGCSCYLLLQPQEQLGAVVMTNQSNEEIYNTQMMELFFGKYQRDIYTGEETIPAGIFRSARNVRKGPFKILSFSYCMNEVDDAQLWIYDSSLGIRKIVYPYGDYIEVPLSVFLVEIGLTLLWLVGIIFSLVVLCVKFIRFIIRKIRGGEKNHAVLKGWCTAAGFLQIAVLLPLAGAFLRAFNYELGRSFIWMFGVTGVFALVMLAMACFGVRKNRVAAQKRGRKVLYYITAAFLVVTVINICYWNLFMFWKV